MNIDHLKNKKFEREIPIENIMDVSTEIISQIADEIKDEYDPDLYKLSECIMSNLINQIKLFPLSGNVDITNYSNLLYAFCHLNLSMLVNMPFLKISDILVHDYNGPIKHKLHDATYNSEFLFNALDYRLKIPKRPDIGDVDIQFIKNMYEEFLNSIILYVNDDISNQMLNFFENSADILDVVETDDFSNVVEVIVKEIRKMEIEGSSISWIVIPEMFFDLLYDEKVFCKYGEVWFNDENQTLNIGEEYSIPICVAPIEDNYFVLGAKDSDNAMPFGTMLYTLVSPIPGSSITETTDLLETNAQSILNFIEYNHTLKNLKLIPVIIEKDLED